MTMAITLSSISLLDTGFLSKAKSGTQVGVASRANSGAALTIKAMQLDITSTANLDDSPYIGVYDEIDAPLISTNPTQFTLTFMINRFNTDTNNYWQINDTALLAQIVRLAKTPGVKALYYPVKTSGVAANTQNVLRQMVYWIGAVDASNIPQGDISIELSTNNTTSTTGNTLKDVNYVACRFNSVQMSHDPTNVLKVVLSGVFTQ